MSHRTFSKRMALAGLSSIIEPASPSFYALTMAKENQILRTQLVELLESKHAHLPLSGALEGLSPEMRGKRHRNVPWSIWQLVEHLRIAQADILGFCLNADHVSPEWPEGYWPHEAAPRDTRAWNASIKHYSADRAALTQLIKSRRSDLLAPLHGNPEYSLLREALTAADHSAYHIGQIILLRRILQAWTE